MSPERMKANAQKLEKHFKSLKVGPDTLCKSQTRLVSALPGMAKPLSIGWIYLVCARCGHALAKKAGR